ncbi:hypothetical protein X802_04010 [Thermococcus guaymasensis DSM 11113]|uniref:KaiC-like domain-containing protein n=1 Tax=Thermococcus guaymasensis DSM 11113 TaxID=1432656 RepID=A0A0X1KNA8_9EURY|nr:DUF257 family protein [Thermococcus guaymasensis]AJC72700.1 hypothetical protein X802_04010 [Thermococcus guaymasensis DSM 11113]
MDTILDTLTNAKEGIILVEYPSRGHPELTFLEIVKSWKQKGVTPLIVDIWDTLHVFLQNLKFEGIELSVEDIPVIKERGIVKVGKVIGRVDVMEDFEYHLAAYGQVARKVPEDSRNHTIVLGMEKFSFTFIDDPPKLERYFETITRRYLSIKGRTSFLFLNTDIASEYLRKGLEQDSDYVLRVNGKRIHLLKSPGVAENEL